MKVSIAINNYNYGSFITECVESVLNQSYQNIEIIIVDDGSTDNSLQVLKDQFLNHNSIKIIEKSNGGQLSAFNETVKHITGEIICFLDADDLYKPSYIEELVNIYHLNNDVDFVYTAMERFYSDGSTEIVQKYDENKNIGLTAISTLYKREWVGSPTSAISMRVSLFNKIVPIPFETDWITRADDCLVFGSSIYGANKYYFSKALVSYRIHGNNHYQGKQFSTEYRYKRELNITKLFNFFKNNILLKDYNLEKLIRLEYKTRGLSDLNTFKQYIKIVRDSNIPFFRKCDLIMKLLKEFRKKRSQKN